MEENIPYWRVGLGYALVGIGVGFAGTPAHRARRAGADGRRSVDAEKTVVTDPAPITGFESWGGWKLM
jgi:hypothetical protein